MSLRELETQIKDRLREMKIRSEDRSKYAVHYAVGYNYGIDDAYAAVNELFKDARLRGLK